MRGDGSERHSTVQRSRAHRPDQLGWRPVLPAGTGGAARRGRPIDFRIYKAYIQPKVTNVGGP